METYADMDEQGKGVEEDRDAALEYYRRAVDASGGRLTASVIAVRRLQG
jgi:TPR repeat protein